MDAPSICTPPSSRVLGNYLGFALYLQKNSSALKMYKNRLQGKSTAEGFYQMGVPAVRVELLAVVCWQGVGAWFQITSALSLLQEDSTCMT